MALYTYSSQEVAINYKGAPITGLAVDQSTADKAASLSISETNLPLAGAIQTGSVNNNLVY